MITLITGQPGNGKTAFAVWNIIREEIAKNRIVYTNGIPKLKLPTIPLTSKELASWHEVNPKINPDDEDEIPLLKNIDEGSLIVIDEVQKHWKPTGTTVSPDIAALDTHRHHGMDFVLLTQFPSLIHKTARVFVSKHYHIRNTWKGRQLLEYPEYQENPACKSALTHATISKYVLPKQAFDLYESATIHTKLKHTTPIAFYVFVAALFAVPALGYVAYNRVMAKTKPKPVLVQESAPSALSVSDNALSNNEQNYTTSVPAFENVRIVSNQYDWSIIAGCVASKTKCICYGDSSELLIIPESVCRSAVHSGWAGRESKQPSPPVKQNENNQNTSTTPPVSNV